MPRPYPWKAGDVVGHWIFVERVCKNKVKVQCRNCDDVQIIYSYYLSSLGRKQKLCDKCHNGERRIDCLTDEEVKHYREKYKNGVTVDILREWLGG